MLAVTSISQESFQQTARILDGRLLSRSILESLRHKVVALSNSHGIRPLLEIIQVDSRPESNLYIARKRKAAVNIGIECRLSNFLSTADPLHVLERIKQLNADKTVHGILVQLPLPTGWANEPFYSAVDPHKDVDGLNPINLGSLVNGTPFIIPCTPKGIMRLLAHENIKLAGKSAVILGRSRIVGLPMMHLLLSANCTTTLCHSKTQHLEYHVKSADILVSAIGQPHIIPSSWLKPGAVIIDVGVNFLPPDHNSSKSRIVGDVEMDGAECVVSAYTPVPGGVGPMTIAMLLENVVEAAETFSGTNGKIL